jgi:non-ribosomal peptide synthetase-like protein
VKIGDNNFLGNNIHFPVGAKTGANVLLGTKVMVPIDGPVREDVGLLGSPCFEIPRAVDQDASKLQAYSDPDLRAERIRRKNAFNIKTMGYFLLSAFVLAYAGMLGLYVSVLYYPLYGQLSLAAFGLGFTAVAVAYLVFAEWASIRFRRLRPQTVSIYDDYFWLHERYWKFYDSPIHSLFKGTPFKNVISRMMGVNVGRKVFDDGCHFVEKSLIEIGDYANLNEGAVLQGHSLEEGIFKSDHIRIGAGSSLGAATFVHYGVTMGENVVLDPDSFLMKGEIAEDGSVWQGNPARAIVTRSARRVVAMVVSAPRRAPAASLQLKDAA